MVKTPIFISGIGRSGTSAVISSMATHSDVVTPDRVGEAPFVGRFISFLREYEDTSPARDYHLKNYQLEEQGRAEQFSRLLAMLQYGWDISGDDVAGQHWIAKVSLSEEDFDKAHKVLGDLKCIYVMRNGIEVVNSAKSFHGFADLTFEQLCTRWVQNIRQCDYVHHRSNCAVVKHHELVADPASVYESVFEELGLNPDEKPAQFIATNLFNSSFDQTSTLKSTGSVFNERLKCWADWSAEEQEAFVSICDAEMVAHEFERPYTSASTDDGMNSGSVAEVVEITTGKQRKMNQISDEQARQLSEVTSLAHESISPALMKYLANPSMRHSYFFMENPKVASTTILTRLQTKEVVPEMDPVENVHAREKSPIPTITSLSEIAQWRMLISDEVFRFTFVRNPYGRLLSAYLSKIDKSLRAKAEILGVINGVDKSEITDLTQPVSFQEFVDAVCVQDIDDMNPHWKPQTCITLIDAIDYHFIGRFERLHEDFGYVCNRLFGTSATLPDSRNKTGSSSKMEQFYDTDTQQKVLQRYESDFAAFGYNDDIARVLEPGGKTEPELKVAR